ncbi:MAG: sulfite exporter TauE/SafE family protein [Acidimicrobiia bacterium]
MIDIVGLIVLGLVAGMFAASLGIGGGIIFVPVLVSVFSFSQLDAQGTSLAVIVPTAIIATIGHMRADRVVWKVALFTGVAGIVGALIGSQVAYLVDEAILRRVFALVLAGLAVRMALRARSIRPNGSVDRT